MHFCLDSPPSYDSLYGPVRHRSRETTDDNYDYMVEQWKAFFRTLFYIVGMLRSVSYITIFEDVNERGIYSGKPIDCGHVLVKGITSDTGWIKRIVKYYLWKIWLMALAQSSCFVYHCLGIIVIVSIVARQTTYGNEHNIIKSCYTFIFVWYHTASTYIQNYHCCLFHALDGGFIASCMELNQLLWDLNSYRSFRTRCW